MTREIAEEIQVDDKIIVGGKEWEVMDICEGDDGIMFSGHRNGSYEIFSFREAEVISSSL